MSSKLTGMVNGVEVIHKPGGNELKLGKLFISHILLI